MSLTGAIKKIIVAGALVAALANSASAHQISKNDQKLLSQQDCVTDIQEAGQSIENLSPKQNKMLEDLKKFILAAEIHLSDVKKYKESGEANKMRDAIINTREYINLSRKIIINL